MVIIIIILFIICIILGYLLLQKKEKDNATERYNEELHKAKVQLEENIYELKHCIELTNQDIDNCIRTKHRLSQDIDEQNKLLDDLKNRNEEIANQAYSTYAEILESSYVKIEGDFDGRVARLKNDLASVQNELNKLKETRAAAHEALLKEQEVKENKDNYRLLPSQADLADARRLEIVKRELNKPRILAMLVWQTYWQPIAKKQFPIILQAKTKTGIYKITNIITDECYIGQAVDIYKRWNEHCKCGLGIDTPPGNKLYKAIQEYGLENFTFELIEECSSIDLNEKEKYFIELYQADTYGYNSNKGVSR